MMGLQLERIKRARFIDRVVVATSSEEHDDPIENFCLGERVACYRGSLADVLGRFERAMSRFGPASHIVRLTADCPLIDWTVIDAAIRLHLSQGTDYTGNVVERTYPDGLDVEVMTSAALQRAAKEAQESYDREHVTSYIYTKSDLFTAAHLKQRNDLSKLRWTVDDASDFKMVSAVYEALYPVNPRFVQSDILDLLYKQPNISSINT